MAGSAKADRDSYIGLYSGSIDIRYVRRDSGENRLMSLESEVAYIYVVVGGLEILSFAA